MYILSLQNLRCHLLQAASVEFRVKIVAFIQILRQQDLFKAPGIAETLDFASALVELDETELNSATLKDMLGTLVKYRDDLTKIQKGDLDTWVEDARRLSIAKEL